MAQEKSRQIEIFSNLEVFFADGQSVVNKVFSSHCLPTDLTLATLRVIGFASQLYAISFDQILTYHARVLKFLQETSKSLVTWDETRDVLISEIFLGSK